MCSLIMLFFDRSDTCIATCTNCIPWKCANMSLLLLKGAMISSTSWATQLLTSSMMMNSVISSNLVVHLCDRIWCSFRALISPITLWMSLWNFVNILNLWKNSMMLMWNLRQSLKLIQCMAQITRTNVLQSLLVENQAISRIRSAKKWRASIICSTTQIPMIWLIVKSFGIRNQRCMHLGIHGG